ncbi:MAG: type II secretion system protein N [Gammaproteobacteria bacterium]
MAKRLKAVWKPALFFFVCLVIALLINMPVSQLLAQVTIPDKVRISRLQGTVFKGQAGELVINQFPIRQLEYQVNLSCLLTASLCYRIDFEDGTAMLSFNPISNSIQVTGFEANIPMQSLAAMSNQLLVSPSGSLMLKTDNFTIRQGKLVDINGTAIWKNAGIVGEDFDLGDYQIDIERGIDLYQFVLKDNDGMLDIKGKGMLASDGKYTINIDIRAQSRTDSRVKNVLELIARKKGLNQYLVHHSGQLDSRWVSFLSADGN